MPYFYVVVASDPNGDPLAYSLAPTAPNNMAIDQQGLLSWTPSSLDMGSHIVEVRVTDGRGGEAVQSFALEVVADTFNTSPQIVSNPGLGVVLGSTYTYQGEARDAEGDAVVWRLDAAPRGMSISAATGEMFWTPAADQVGPDNLVVLRVTDTFGATSSQSFKIQVRGGNRPPMILSAPPTEAFAGESYVYAVQAQDPDGDSMLFTLVDSGYPDGMAIESDTGFIQWLPSDLQLGTHTVSLMVQDAFGGIDVQEFAIEVIDADLNLAPVITSTPDYQVSAGHLYVYDVQVIDPEGDQVAYSLEGLGLPPGMVIDAEGMITWSPTVQDVGQYVVTVVATDTASNRATQSYALTVARTRHRQSNQQDAPVARLVYLTVMNCVATDPEHMCRHTASLSRPPV